MSLAASTPLECSLGARYVQPRLRFNYTDSASNQLNTEYVFGLLSHLSDSQFTLFGTPQSYEVVHFAAHQNIVSAAVIIEFNFTTLGNLITPIELDVWVCILPTTLFCVFVDVSC